MAERNSRNVFWPWHRAVGMLVFFVAAPALAASAPTPCPAIGSSSNFSGKTFLNCNFSGWDLTSADFSGATLQNAAFLGTNLTSAKFNGATIQSNVGDAAMLTNFSFANLSRASFVGATFTGPVYFTYAALTCADFSKTDVTKNAIFGDSLSFDAKVQGCKVKFQQATMGCDLLPQWNLFDLTQANVSACKALLETPPGGPGHDFSGGLYANVNFDGMNLAGSKWDGAVLTGASFQEAILDNATGLASRDLTQVRFALASLKKVDLSAAGLYAAVLDNANLEGANLAGAYLSPCQPPASCVAATARGAHLKNVNLVGSHLENADFSNANFYSSEPAGDKSCDTTKGNCASAKSATLTDTKFNNAYLYGVDFSGAGMHGVIFDGAVLVGANFTGATVAPEPDQVNGSFVNAFLQGANMAEATLDGVSMAGAFLDFNPNGNSMLIQLNTTHTKFAGWHAPDQPVCVKVTYGKWASVPTDKPNITCPDGLKHADSGCGSALSSSPPNPRWDNRTNIATYDPKASYTDDATYTPKAANICERDFSW